MARNPKQYSDEKVREAYNSAHGFFDSIKDQMYERAKSPLIGAFLIAWSAINYRAIYALLTANSYEQAFRIIDTKIWYDFYSTFGNTLLFPLAFALSYLFIVPKLEKLAVNVWISGKLEVRKERLRLEGSAPLEEVTAGEFQDHINALDAQYRSELSAIVSRNSEQLIEANRRYDVMRQKYSRSLIPEDEIGTVLQSMSEEVRDILWVTKNLQKKTNEAVRAEAIQDALKPIRGEINLRSLGSAFFQLSMYGLTEEELASPSLGGYLTLSLRGRDLASKMEEAGFSPNIAN